MTPQAKKRLYRAGSRNNKYRNDGSLSPNRLAWIRTIMGQFIIMKDEFRSEDEEEEREVNQEIGPTIRFMIPTRYKPMTFNFTALTKEELDLTREFFNLLFEVAEPIVIHRDKIAKAAFDAGDDSDSRSYRQKPQLVIREGKGNLTAEAIWDRETPEEEEDTTSR